MSASKTHKSLFSSGISAGEKLVTLHILATASRQMLLPINTCIAHGGWVPGLELPTPTQVAKAPQKSALPATSHEPRQPYQAPAQAPVTQSQKLRGNNDNSNSQ